MENSNKNTARNRFLNARSRARVHFSSVRTCPHNQRFMVLVHND